ncbi:alpha/beta hydrolase [Actinoplanes bogorensis]|uniref:Alpha/beta hydrolase n=1 Tax=Paractinoplanes bogorensis TaxID=1610840 RepID=A0ABS5Z175_9ACTN|nr:alpha/beta hydrolase [Actinoplanes bogorensis]MBU2668145.1 alpha/beta hydrolase [Actinoplanes bogorensis]
MSWEAVDAVRSDVVRDGVRTAVWRAGRGSPVLLLHGYPQCHLMWRHVAADLARDHEVVVTDLRGYGASSAPPDDAEHTVYSKREMAADQARVMRELGHERFAVVGHDRGGRVAHRLALDFPEEVTSVAVLDIVPTLHMYEHVDRAMAETYFHWFLLSRPAPLPEELIGAAPDAWIAGRFRGRHAGGRVIEAEAIEAYARYFRRPATIAASCADYRAAATTDLAHDRADRAARRRLGMPVLAAWGATSYVGRHFDVSGTWRAVADHVTGRALPADHYVPEEAPVELCEALREFWRVPR